MKFYLLSLSICGIKCIDKEITIDFYNSIIKKPFNHNVSNVKAIYGENGTGKSAIINAIDIYQKITTNEGYLYNEKAKHYLQELISHRTNELTIKVKFLYDLGSESYVVEETDDFIVYEHEITLSNANKESEMFIKEEVLYKYPINTSRTERRKTLFSCKQGIIENSQFSDKTKVHYMNLLDKRSVLDVTFFDVRKKVALLEKSDKYVSSQVKNDINEFGIPILFTRELFIELEDSDSHELFASSYRKEYSKAKNYEELLYAIEDVSEVYVLPNKKYSNLVSIIDKKIYENYIKRAFQFLKLFKPNLVDLVVEFKPFSNAKVIAELFFVYEDGQIYFDFESSGIKKLFHLFNAFCAIQSGKIVFIDELDASIHDVVLMRLIEYFSNFSNGQLIFTTHNVDPMEVLKSKSHSIDFLTTNSKITSWKKNGSYSVSKLYRNGLIKGLPFNISDIDFIGVFEDD